MAALSEGMLLTDLHAKFVSQLDKIVMWKFQHLKMNGVFWGLGVLHLLGKDYFNVDDAIAFVRSCYNEDGGFGGNVSQSSHMLYTLSAIEILCYYDRMDVLDVGKTVAWFASMQLPDGSFQGDVWGEVDTRFVYIALNALSLLGALDAVDVPKAVEWVLSCQNWDGGFGVAPGAESHAGQVFCCVGALRIADALDRIDGDRLAAWLAMRQLPSGGLNGRPEKKADVCYSWWVISSLSMLGRLSWIDRNALFRYILSCQDDEDGGIADKPGNAPDVYHTFYGLCGLSLLDYPGFPLKQVNPCYALPYEVLERVGVTEKHGLHVGRR